VFPPKPTKNPQEWLKALWSSLQRGGHHFGAEAFLEQGSDGSVRMQSKMHEELPDSMRPMVKAYMRQYARASGWTLKKLSFRKGYCEIEASSSALSSSSTKS
jgi:hypothetical protein